MRDNIQKIIRVGLVLISLCLLSKNDIWAGELLPEEKAMIEVFETASPSVAFIKNAGLQWDWFSSDVYEVPQGVGSGFVWDTQGHIITNFHVIYEAAKIDVVFSKNESYPAKVVGYSADHEIAVLKINAPAERLKPLALGSSHDLKVGQKVLAIGNPFGLDHSMASGVVSALGRSMSSMTGRKIYDVIQTDAAINPGNSGGPLLNSSGELIGVATAIYSPSGASAGVGFGIPVDTLKKVVPQLIQYGRVKRMGLGVVLVPDHLRERLGIEGAMILDVPTDSAAKKAGLRPTRKDRYGYVIYGDIIVAVDGHPVRNNSDLSECFEKNKKSGDRVVIRFFRGDAEMETSAVLQEI